MVKNPRLPQRSLRQVYQIEGYKGIVAIMPELRGRTVRAQQSAAYRIAGGKEGKGYKGSPPQEVSKATITAANKRAGRLLAQKTLRTESGAIVRTDDGKPMKVPISPQNYGKLAVRGKSLELKEKREKLKKERAAGDWDEKPEAYRAKMEQNAPLTARERSDLMENIPSEKRGRERAAMRAEIERQFSDGEIDADEYDDMMDEFIEDDDFDWDYFRSAYEQTGG